MRVGGKAALKSNRERVGIVTEIDDYDIVTLKMKDTGETESYDINQLIEIE